MNLEKYWVVSLMLIYIILFINKNLYSQCSLPFTICPGDLTIIDCDNSADELMDWPLPVANPAGFCYNYTLTQIAGPQRGSIVPLGTYLIIYHAEAQDINTQNYSSNSCQFFVTVAKDLQPPVFTYCPPNITLHGVDDGTGNCIATTYWPLPISSDNCDNSLTSNSNTPCGTGFSEGTHTVNYTSTDLSGNVSTCTFTVVVVCTSATFNPQNPVSVDRIYPNPTNGEIIIRLSGVTKNEEEIQIVGVAGNVLLRKVIKQGSETDSFDASWLPAGMYFLQILSKGQVITVNKFIKQ